ncbi:metalloregulator ArsR/SmtB family transcription factor [Chroococcidiopsis sp.]|uniref:ArsR/SmtB family transcription factor n=1 Tax=Chroococcidiopsis sp. TaxID=3088168 RepID=UPI003F2E8C92
MENKETAQYADIFAALGSEPRLEIMRSLFAAYPEGRTVGEIQAVLNIPNSTLSHHLEKLRHEGLVNAKRDKQFLWYSANAATMEDLLSFLYNGCSIRQHTSKADETYSSAELIQNESTYGGFMFEGFLRSLEGFFGSIFDRVALPIGFERFTQQAIQAIILAQYEAKRLKHHYIGTEQLLLGVVAEESGLPARVLTAMGVNFENTRIEVEKRIGRGTGSPRSEVPFTPRAKQCLEFSLKQAREFNHRHIGTEHLLLGILREGQGMGVIVLRNLGVDLENLEQRLRTEMGNEPRLSE